MNTQLYGSDWAVIGILLLAAGATGFALLTLNQIIAPSRPNPVKAMPYESGVPQVTATRPRFTPRFYVVAMLFVVFDIEAIFIFPWAVVFDDLGVYGFVAMLAFMFLLFDGLIYAWKKGALEWA
ncbi:MAG TPA: NADH-quinone oxidoreductase subunit A [Thermomicrobiales bacterium]|nr:NADH-quinone oxidoreductase subunit A [Thermomicrobiales bacterium]